MLDLWQAALAPDSAALLDLRRHLTTSLVRRVTPAALLAEARPLNSNEYNITRFSGQDLRWILF